METDIEHAPTIRRRLSTRRLLTTAIVMIGGYWLVARGSIGGGAGGVASDGSWVDAQGQPTTDAPLTFTVTILPSPLIALVVLLLLGVAWATSEVRGQHAWLAPACEVAAVVVPIVAIAGVYVWIFAFGRAWEAGVPISPPWWASSIVTVDRMP